MSGSRRARSRRSRTSASLRSATTRMATAQPTQVTTVVSQPNGDIRASGDSPVARPRPPATSTSTPAVSAREPSTAVATDGQRNRIGSTPPTVVTHRSPATATAGTTTASRPTPGRGSGRRAMSGRTVRAMTSATVRYAARSSAGRGLSSGATPTSAAVAPFTQVESRRNASGPPRASVDVHSSRVVRSTPPLPCATAPWHLRDARPGQRLLPGGSARRPGCARGAAGEFWRS